MSSSSNRSATIPLSFDRFRARSLQFLSPFQHQHYDKSTKQSPDRSWLRKIQVHPNEGLPTGSNQIDYNVAHLFHADSKALKTPQNKKCSKNVSNTRSTSNVIEAIDSSKLSTTNSSRRDILGHPCPPTPCMIGYRHSSLPNLIPTRVIKRPKTLKNLIKPSDVDHFNA